MKVFKITNQNANLLNKLNRRETGTILFYHPQCSHCMALKPEWEKMKDELLKQKRNCNLFEVNGEYMDSINHPVKNVVDGFPTIVNVNNGKISNFEKERNADNMMNFILENLPSGNVNKLPASKRLSSRRVTFNLNNENNLIKKKKVLNAKHIKNSIKLHKNKKGKTQRKKRKGKQKGGRKLNRRTRRNRRK